jgi:NAD(P)-dependent dehydrogenase (short-subunit alcohol dehydrogenase family)
MAVMDLFRLDGKRALITGGSRGLGRAVAQAFAEAGADLVLVGRTPDSLAAAARELAALGRRIDVVVADLHAAEAAETMCASVLEQFGPVDVLVNNVGGRREDIPTEAMTLDAWRGFLDLNLTSGVVCTQQLGAAMLARGWGRVINIASIAGPLVAMRGIEGRHYETAKAALVGFTRSVAADWAKRGVTVNAIAPGGFLTEANRRWFRERPSFQTDFEANIPMGRLGEPEEIGPLALYLASDASRYMTGAVLVLDGGYTLW